MKRFANFVTAGYENEAGMMEHEAGLYVLYAEAKKEIDALQAKIDALMLEYCPGEMSKEQIDEFDKHQDCDYGCYADLKPGGNP